MCIVTVNHVKGSLLVESNFFKSTETSLKSVGCKTRGTWFVLIGLYKEKCPSITKKIKSVSSRILTLYISSSSSPSASTSPAPCRSHDMARRISGPMSCSVRRPACQERNHNTRSDRCHSWFIQMCISVRLSIIVEFF